MTKVGVCMQRLYAAVNFLFVLQLACELFKISINFYIFIYEVCTKPIF